MIFNSFQFFLFFIVVWLLCAVILRPRRIRAIFPQLSRLAVIEARNVVLLLASYVFYGAWDYRFLGLLALSTTADFLIGRAISGEADAGRRKLYVTLSIIGNLSLLGFFKYFGFFATSLASLFDKLGIHLGPVVLQIVLPVGISFYTFQSLAYTIDVYRGTIKAERWFHRFALFVAFFPQLVAGPIERPESLIPQFGHVRHVTWARVSSGAYLIAVGLFKKVVIADTVAQVADAAFALREPTGIQVLLGAYAFAFQIYADFSGYSDIARGSARCLGFDLSRNFALPYFSATPSEFWRRWHISLSRWLRDYLYISLGGNRGGTARTYRNLMLTMLLGGLWHGAAWTYLAWGGIHGVLLCVYRALEPAARGWTTALGPMARRLSRVVAILVFFHLVCASWIFFRAASIQQALGLLSALAVTSTTDLAKALGQLGPIWLSIGLVTSLVAVQLLEELKRDHWLVFRAPVPIRGTVYAAAAVLFVWFGEDGDAPFIYFQF